MKTALFTEFSVAKALLVQMAGTFLLCGLMIAYFCESLYALTACIAAMMPFMMLFILSAYDAQNGWERFRACLPTSRAALVTSRYVLVCAATAGACLAGCLLAFAIGAAAPNLAFLGELGASLAENAAHPELIVASSILGACLIMLIVCIMMPLILRFGMSTAMRIAPMIMVMLIPAGSALMPQFADQPLFLQHAITWAQANIAPSLALAVAATLALYAISCAVAIFLYRNKEL